MKPPPLKDDCFAMPPGVDWTPVDEALDRLRAGLHPVVSTRTLPAAQAIGRVLAKDVIAARSHPPFANSAVDGYGFAFASLPDADVIEVPLAAGRSAAGAAFDGVVAPGQALRILTGARLPDGVDTVVLEEDCTVTADRIAFRKGLKPGANVRAAGEDITAGDTILTQGTLLRAQEAAVIASTGVLEVPVFDPLRVGVLSTGDEVVGAGAAGPTQIYDANRPMLLALVESWGYVPVDLGHVRDDADAVREKLDTAATQADVILTSGGASAGDEDHISAVLAASGGLQTWRIAVKPGRPLALALWRGVPVFGLPGNPVAAMVCTMIFGRPAMMALSGAGWRPPTTFEVPAAFSKRKKPGRREYLRARLRDGKAEVFGSEGSGRVSGLAWAEGLVELPDGEAQIEPGQLVKYLPFSGM
ncbi:MAG: gephyrin-like molybdotransferase Glp [Pseudomonadota bacterium]